MIIKKIISTSLLAIIFLLPISFSLFSIVKRNVIYEEMEEMLESAPTKKICIHKNSAIWLRDKKEVVINGNLFDVKSIELKGDSLILSGIFDDKEKSLNELLIEENQKEKQGSLPIKYLLLFPLIYSESEITNFLLTNSNNTIYFSYQEPISNSAIQIEAPPPRS